MFFSRVCVIAGALLIAASAQASDFCPVIPATSIEVQSAVIQPEVKPDTLKHLTAYAEQVRPGEADGLTVISFAEDDDVTQTRDRHGCNTLNIEVNLRPASATVFMADSLSPSSCRYRAVMGHEMHHVQIAQDALDHTATALQKQLQSALPQALALLEASNRGQLSPDALQAFIKKRSVDALRIVSAEYQAGNERLDVPAEGDRLFRECNPGPNFGSSGGRKTPHAYIGDQQIN
jgi:hypothetical protein